MSTFTLYSILVCLLATVISPVTAAVPASRTETNAQRMANGLPPAAPRWLFGPDKTHPGHNPHPSNSPGMCPPGRQPQCCDDVQDSSANMPAQLMALLGMKLPYHVPVGMTCNNNIYYCPGTITCCDKVYWGGELGVDCHPPIGKW